MKIPVLIPALSMLAVVTATAQEPDLSDAAILLIGWNLRMADVQMHPPSPLWAFSIVRPVSRSKSQRQPAPNETPILCQTLARVQSAMTIQRLTGKEEHAVGPA